MTAEVLRLPFVFIPDGEFFDEWVDYATVAIGLYAAAAGLPIDCGLAD